jgi:hypothetical protein
LDSLHKTWEFSKKPWVHIWTNRFHAEAFEGYEDLIQDPRKIKSDTMTEWFDMYNAYYKRFERPECYWDRWDVCFIKDFCHNIENRWNKSNLTKKLLNWTKIDTFNEDILVLRWEEFPSEVYKKYWKKDDFLSYLKENWSVNKIMNVPPCLSWREETLYEKYNEVQNENTLEDFVQNYIKNLYRKKSTKCVNCLYNKDCEGIHINFIRSYGFDILKPIQWKK